MLSKAKKKKLQQIKRLALCLDTHGLDGRSVTAPLAGAVDLRQGDAHISGRNLRDSLKLFGLDPNEQNYQLMSFTIISEIAKSFQKIAESLAK